VNLLSAAAKVSSLTMLSRITGLLRETLIARTYGASEWTDAFNVAFRIPNLLRRLFAEGAFSQAFVPVLGETNAKAVYSAFLFVAVLITTPISWITLFALPLASALSKEVSNKKGAELISTLGKTGRYQLLLALLIMVGSKI